MTRCPHPDLPGDVVEDERVIDREASWPVVAARTLCSHPFLSLDADTVRSPDGGTFDRVYVRHKGGVGVVALDDQDRVLLLEQYRHPARARLVELPAGVLDHDGEEPRETAVRELAEEADLVAREWSTLLGLYASPGSSDEYWRVYLARGLTAVTTSRRPALEHEEADMDRVWVPLRDAVDAVLRGEIGDAMAVSGLLAAWTRVAP